MPWRTRNRRNHATAARPTTKAIAIATNSWGPVALMPSETGRKASGSENSPEANTAGMASRKPNRAANSRSRPRKRPALMVAPDRETPGTNASVWAMLTSTASRRGRCSTQLLDVGALPSDALGKRDHRRKRHQRRRNHPQVAHARTDLVLEEHTQHADRDGSDDDVPTEPVIGRAMGGGAKAAEPRCEDPHNVASEIHQHSGLGAQLGHGSERRAGIAGEEEPRHDRQVP